MPFMQKKPIDVSYDYFFYLKKYTKKKKTSVHSMTDHVGWKYFRNKWTLDLEGRTASKGDSMLSHMVHRKVLSHEDSSYCSSVLTAFGSRVDKQAKGK